MATLDIKSLGSDQLAEGLHSWLAPEVVALQPVAVIDHVCAVTREQLAAAIGQDSEAGGSSQISIDELSSILGACFSGCVELWLALPFPACLLSMTTTSSDDSILWQRMSESFIPKPEEALQTL